MDATRPSTALLKRPAAVTARWRRREAGLLPTQPDASGAAPVNPALVGAMDPSQILQEDEIVLVLTKPSVMWIFYSCLPFLIAVTLLGILAVQIASATLWMTPRNIAWLAAAIASARLIWSLLIWTSHTYM